MYTLKNPVPTGDCGIGGPIGDTGLTGRKIIVDTYGGVARRGGRLVESEFNTLIVPANLHR